MPRLAAALLASFLVLPAVVGGVTQDDADDALAVEDELTFTRKGADGGDSAGTKKEPRYFPGKPGPGAPEEKQREVPLAKVENHRILGKDDLTYDFLAEMGFVPPPPPPPWGFSKVNGSLDEIEERVMRQLIPVADLPPTMLCDVCGAITLQFARAFAAKVAGKPGKSGKPRKLKEFEVIETIEAVCAGQLSRYRPTEEEVEARDGSWEQPETWDEYGVADMNLTCASPPEVSCWNSTKRLVGPGAPKDYEFLRRKERKFGWLTTRITPECTRLADDVGEYELYAMALQLEGGLGNGTALKAALCGRDCDRAGEAQAIEAHNKYTADYEKWEQRQKWAKEMGYDQDMPPNSDEVAEARAKSKKRAKEAGQPAKKKKKKKKKKGGKGKKEEL